MFLLLIITASIYFILGDVGDGIIMLCFVLFISGIEFVQERKTDRALDALNTLSSLNIKILPVYNKNTEKSSNKTIYFIF